MNERIRELAKEALDYAEKNQSAEVQQHWFKLYNEKFAELIVRECMNVIYNIDDLGGYHFKAVNEVKTHFGVKE